MSRQHAGQGADLLGHPRGLSVLFLTETWEKFSYYGMRAILIYYMTQTLLLPQAQASAIYGYYTAAAYVTPVLGGWVADRWLGRKAAVLAGGAIMALGHFMMASEALFFPALAAIAFGNGLFLPNLPAQISGLYAHEDPRRMAAYNVYYAGINLGAFLAPLVCGALGERLGWHWGFGAAGAGMVAALAIYVAGARWLPADRPASRTSTSLQRTTGLRAPLFFLAAVIAAVVIFRAAYEQIGNTVAVFTQAEVDRSLTDGLDIPMAWFQALNPLFVFVLTPFLAVVWKAPAAVSGSVRRMAAGAVVVALSYLLLALAGGAQAGPAHWSWLVAFFLLITLGELLILPVGLGVFGRLSPAHQAGAMIAAWFFASAAGNLLAGQLGAVWSRTTPATFFILTAGVAAAAGALLALIALRAPRPEGP